MFEQQHFLDLHGNSDFGDPKSWLAGDENSSPTHARAHSLLANSASVNSAANGSLDRVLYNDLVEMIPLVQSLIVRIPLFLFSYSDLLLEFLGALHFHEKMGWE